MSVPSTMSTTAMVFEPGKIEAAIDFCNYIVESRFLPSSIRTGQQALAVMLKGQELGFQPMESFALINVIQGKPEVNAQGLAAMLMRGGVAIETIELTGEICRLRMTRTIGDQKIVEESEFSKEDAIKAELWGKGNWIKYPKDMLYARAMSRGARHIGPDLIGGCYVQGELQSADKVDYTPEPAVQPGAPREVKAEIVDKAEPQSQAYSMRTIGEPTPDDDYEPEAKNAGDRVANIMAGKSMSDPSRIPTDEELGMDEEGVPF